MTQLLLLKNPLFIRGLSFAQRICYLSSMLYWLFPVARLIFLISPMFFIFFDLKIYVANRQEFLSYTLPYMITAVMLQNHNFGRLRWAWISDIYEYVQSIYLILPIVSVFISPRRPSFNVTAKGQTLEEDHLSPIAGPHLLLFSLVVASGAFLAYRYAHESINRDLFAVVGLWTALNLLLTSVGLGVVCELRERRTAPRVRTSRDAELLLDSGETIACVIEDASFRGAAVLLPLEQSVTFAARTSGRIRLHDAETGSAAAAFEVRTVGRIGAAAVLGVEFSGAIAERARLTSALIFADLQDLRLLRAKRNVDRGVIGGTVMVVGWAGHQLARCMTFLATKQSREPSPNEAPVRRDAVPAASPGGK